MVYRLAAASNDSGSKGTENGSISKSGNECASIQPERWNLDSAKWQHPFDVSDHDIYTN